MLGARPKDEELVAYLDAYFGDRLSEEQRNLVISKTHLLQKRKESDGIFNNALLFIQNILGGSLVESASGPSEDNIVDEASRIASLLLQSTEEMDSVLGGLDGRYIKPKPGGGKFNSTVSLLLTLPS